MYFFRALNRFISERKYGKGSYLLEQLQITSFFFFFFFHSAVCKAFIPIIFIYYPHTLAQELRSQTVVDGIFLQADVRSHFTPGTPSVSSIEGRAHSEAHGRSLLLSPLQCDDAFEAIINWQNRKRFTVPRCCSKRKWRLLS